jgi:hypothetical protein
MLVFWAVIPCELAGRYQRLGVKGYTASTFKAEEPYANVGYLPSKDTSYGGCTGIFLHIRTSIIN